MTKIHYILILLIALSVGTSVYLLQEEEPIADEIDISDKSDEITFDDKRSGAKKDNAKEYVQGALVLPDLTEGFKRCLGRGYTAEDKEVLKRASVYFYDKDFDEGKYRDNTIVYVDNYGERLKLFHDSRKNLITYKQNEEGAFIEVKREKEVTQDQLKELLEGESILVNEYSQIFKKDGLTMELLLSNGVMKFLNIFTKNKKIACKP